MRHLTALFGLASLFCAACSHIPQENDISPIGSEIVTRRGSQRDLSYYHIKCFAMDSKDLMWLGTDKNLMSYDGQNSRPFIPSVQGDRLPSGNILCLFDDHASKVWVGTDKGFCSYERYNRFNNYLFNGEQLKNVSQIVETADSVLVVKSDNDYFRLMPGGSLEMIPSLHQETVRSKAVPDGNGGLWIILEDRSVHFDRVFLPVDTIENPGSANIPNLDAVRKEDMMWVLQTDILSCINVNNGTLIFSTKSPVPGEVDFIFYEDPYLLVKGKDDGLTVLDPYSGQVVSHDLPYIPSAPSRSDISCMYHDHIGNLWIGYTHFGVKCISKEDKSLSLTNESALYHDTKGHYIFFLTKDSGGRIWGSMEDGLFLSDKDQVTFFSKDAFPGCGLFNNMIVDNDHLWLVDGNCLYSADHTGNKVQIKRKWEMVGVIHDVLANGNVCYVLDGSPYIHVVSMDDNQEIIRGEPPLDGNNALFLDIDPNHALVICQEAEFYFLDKRRDCLVKLFEDKEDVAIQEGEFFVDAILVGHKVYLAANEGGVLTLDLDSGQMEKVVALSQLYISSLISYTDDILIMSSEDGIAYYNTKDQSVRVFKLRLGTSSPTINSFRRMVRGNNAIILGTNNGCVTIPASIPKTAGQHHLSVHAVSITDEGGSRTVYLAPDEKLCVFNHKHNSFEITYGAVHYDNQPIVTQYMLEGYNPSWISGATSGTVQFSKIPAGEYRFKLRELQPFSETVLNESNMDVIIKKAPWNTIPAIISYIILSFLLIFFVVKQISLMRDSRDKLSLAEQKHDLERRTNQMNSNFFANIVHEFRNPLTIISAPLVSLLNDPAIPESAHKKLVAISSSANTMLKLIDQMLDFNQLDMDVLKLCVGEHDLSYELEKNIKVYEESASVRNISIECVGSDVPFFMQIDLDKFEKILGNLFTNAMKHTPNGGVIKFSIDDITREEAAALFPGDLAANRYLCISVTNNGKHIPEDKLVNVFKRYNESSETVVNHKYGWGRGIGLYYVERLVNIQKGAIRVSNVPSGVCFSFIIPSDKDFYKDADKEDSRVHRTMQIDIPERPHPVTPKTGLEDAGKPVLLIVDDDIQIGSYLRSIFEDSYNVFNMYSAEDVIEDIDSISPDIIISDVMMGNMSGVDLCRELKGNLAFCHIPVVLLTGVTNIKEAISGLECGANAYVTKPFSAEYLQALISSLLKNIEHIRESLNTNVKASQIDASLSDTDRAFINQLYQLMDKHLTESDLRVSTICEELRISRTKFNYKLKGLSGCTPGTFFRQYKLNLAAQMLKEGKKNVSEIADMLGFSSISNFSTSFKKMFGISPKDYK